MSTQPELNDDPEPIVTCLTQDMLADGTLRSYPIAIDLSAPRFQIASVSVGLALTRTNVLRELHLGGNALTNLDGICRFEALRVLRAPNNRIVDATLRCPRLTLLDLSSNQLGSLPLLQGCAALLTLDVTDNVIRSGLDHLRHVPLLQALLLGGNLLGVGGSAKQAAFGQALRGLSRLSKLDVRETPLLLLPQPAGLSVQSWLLTHAPKLSSLDGMPVAPGGSPSRTFLKERIAAAGGARASSAATDVDADESAASPGAPLSAAARRGAAPSSPARCGSLASAMADGGRDEGAAGEGDGAGFVDGTSGAVEETGGGGKAYPHTSARAAEGDEGEEGGGEEEAGGLFEVSVRGLAARRACPPPFFLELATLLPLHIHSAASLGACLAAAQHGSLAQPLDRLCGSWSEVASR